MTAEEYAAWLESTAENAKPLWQSLAFGAAKEIRRLVSELAKSEIRNTDSARLCGEIRAELAGLRKFRDEVMFVRDSK